MCRIRFGVTGIYFDDLDTCQPLTIVEEVYQPLISHNPLIVGGKLQQSGCNSPAGSKECSACKALRKDSISANSITQTSTPVPPSLLPSTSSFTSDDALEQRDVKVLAGSATPLQRNEHTRSHRATPNSKAAIPAAAKAKDFDPKVNKEKRTEAVKSTSDTSSHQKSPSFVSQHPAKQVRFSDVVEKMTIPDDEASDTESESSYGSFTDPPPILRKSKLADRQCQSVDVSQSSTPPYVPKSVSETSEDSSSNGSGVDARMQWTTIDTPDQDKLSLKQTSRSSSTASLSGPSSDFESNVDFDGRQREETRFYRQRVRSPLRLNTPASHKTRTQGILPEPILVVRSGKRKSSGGIQDHQPGKENSHMNDTFTFGTRNSKSPVQNKAPSKSIGKEYNSEASRVPFRDV